MPDVIVNTAAMHNVDSCEADPMKSFQVNGLGARNLSLIANELDAILFYLSTDYVFDGKKKTPYVETDYPSAPQRVREQQACRRVLCKDDSEETLRCQGIGTLRRKSLPCKRRKQLRQADAEAVAKREMRFGS